MSGMAWVILPENSVSRVCISLNIEYPKKLRLLHCRVWWSVALWPGCDRGEKSWWTHHQLWWTVHRIHTGGAAQWCAEANTFGNCSRLWRKQTLDFCEGFFVFWVMLQAQIVWFSLEFWSDNFTVALFLFIFPPAISSATIKSVSFPCRDHQSVQVLSVWTSKQSWESLCALTWAGGVKMNQMKIAGSFFVLCFQILIRFLDDF